MHSGLRVQHKSLQKCNNGSTDAWFGNFGHHKDGSACVPYSTADIDLAVFHFGDAEDKVLMPNGYMMVRGGWMLCGPAEEDTSITTTLKLISSVENKADRDVERFEKEKEKLWKWLKDEENDEEIDARAEIKVSQSILAGWKTRKSGIQSETLWCANCLQQKVYTSVYGATNPRILCDNKECKLSSLKSKWLDEDQAADALKRKREEEEDTRINKKTSPP